AAALRRPGAGRGHARIAAARGRGICAYVPSAEPVLSERGEGSMTRANQETKQTALRALWATTKMAWQMDKTCVLILAAAALAGGVRPYIGVLLSAWVVDALAAGEPFARIAGVALLCVGA